MKIDGGATIETFTGIQFHILEPREEEVCIADIAHALSLQCRFTGHTRFHYSVAQHSVYVSEILTAANALEGLLHDASEAYIGDMSRPLKHYSSCGKEYLLIEEKIEKVIRKKFGFPENMSSPVKWADNSLLYKEKEALMKPADWTHNWGEHENVDINIASWTPALAEGRFLQRFYQLTDIHVTA